MKNWKRGLAAIALVAAAAGAVTALAAQGSQEDPLVTLSYLNQVVTPKLESKVTEAVKQNADSLQKQLEEAIAGYESQVDETLAQAGASSRFAEKNLKKGETLTLKAGHEILLTGGGGKAEGELVDTTGGKTLQSGGSLNQGHLYITLSDNGGVTATGEATVFYR